MHGICTSKKFEKENSRNHELTEAVQAIRDMAAALLRNQKHEGTTESRGLVESRRNNFLEDIIQRKSNYRLERLKKSFG